MNRAERVLEAFVKAIGWIIGVPIGIAAGVLVVVFLGLAKVALAPGRWVARRRARRAHEAYARALDLDPALVSRPEFGWLRIEAYVWDQDGRRTIGPHIRPRIEITLARIAAADLGALPDVESAV